MLDPFSRGTMVALSALCVAGTIGLATQSARSSIQPRAAQLAFGPIPDAPQPAGEIVRRDPFAEPAPAVAHAVPAPLSVSGDAGAVDSLPSNLAHDTIPAVPGLEPGMSAPQTRVTAIVTGAHPYAMLEAAGAHTIKGLGDRLDGVAITGIDIDGVALANGQRLRVDAASRL
jgi:hypothetical protein